MSKKVDKKVSKNDALYEKIVDIPKKEIPNEKELEKSYISQFIDTHSKRLLGFIITTEQHVIIIPDKKNKKTKKLEEKIMKKNLFYPVPNGIKDLPMIWGASIIGDESDYIGHLTIYTDLKSEYRKIEELNKYDFFKLYGQILSFEKYYINITNYNTFLESNMETLLDMSKDKKLIESLSSILHWKVIMFLIERLEKERLKENKKKSITSEKKYLNELKSKYIKKLVDSPEFLSKILVGGFGIQTRSQASPAAAAASSVEDPVINLNGAEDNCSVEQINEMTKTACDAYKQLNLVKFREQDIVDPNMLTTISYNIHCRPRLFTPGNIYASTGNCEVDSGPPQLDDMQDIRSGHICSFLNGLETDVVCIQEASDKYAHNIIQDLLYKNGQKYKYKTHDLIFYPIHTEELNDHEKRVFPKAHSFIDENNYYHIYSESRYRDIDATIPLIGKPYYNHVKDGILFTNRPSNKGDPRYLYKKTNGYFLGGIGKLTEEAFRSYGNIDSQSDVTSSSITQYGYVKLVSPSGVLTFSKYPIVSQDCQTFRNRPTADALVFKGIVYTKIQLGNVNKGIQYVHVFNTHPSPYVLFKQDKVDSLKKVAILYDASAWSYYGWGENWIKKRIVNALIQTYKEIEIQHELQLKQIRDFITKKTSGINKETESILVMGDMNINKYDTYERDEINECDLSKPDEPCYLERDGFDFTSIILKELFQEKETFKIKNENNILNILVTELTQIFDSRRILFTNRSGEVVSGYTIEDGYILESWRNIEDKYNKIIESTEITGNMTTFKTVMETFFRNIETTISSINLTDFSDLNQTYREFKDGFITNFRREYTTIRNQIENFRFAQSKLNTGKEYCTNMLQMMGDFEAPKLILDPSYWNIIDNIYAVAGKNQTEDGHEVDNVKKRLRQPKKYTTDSENLSKVVWDILDYTIPKKMVNLFSGENDSKDNLKVLHDDGDGNSGVETGARTNTAFDKKMSVKIIPGSGNELENFPFGYYTWDGTRYGTNIKHTRGNTMTYSPFWPLFLYEMIDHVVFSRQAKQPKHSFVSVIRPIFNKPLRVISYNNVQKSCTKPKYVDEFEAPIWYDLSDHYPIIGRFIFRDTEIYSLTNLDSVKQVKKVSTDSAVIENIKSVRNGDYGLDNIKSIFQSTLGSIVLDVNDEDCSIRRAAEAELAAQQAAARRAEASGHQMAHIRSLGPNA
jgi:hypothetical protein